MRLFVLFFSLLLTASLVLAQDDAAALANQAAQRAMEASQRASEDAMRTSQNASTNAMSQPACCLGALPPGFSVKPGRYSGPVTLRLTDATRGYTFTTRRTAGLPRPHPRAIADRLLLIPLPR